MSGRRFPRLGGAGQMEAALGRRVPGEVRGKFGQASGFWLLILHFSEIRNARL